MSHFETKPGDPLKAPWPRGVILRVFRHPTMGIIHQLRPGCALPADMHHRLRWAAMNLQGTQVCPN